MTALADLRALRYFLTVVQTGSFLAASRALYLSQPALSHQIRKLEDLIGVELLIRHSRGVRPTPAGVELAGQVEQIFALLHDAESKMRSFRDEIAGQLAIGVTPSVGEMLAPRFIELCKAQPRLEITLKQGHSSDIFADVMEGKLAAAFCFEPPAKRAVSRLPLYREPLFLVGPAGVIGNTSRPIPFRRLTEFPLLLDSRSQVFRRSVEAAAASEKVPLNISAEIDDVFLKKGVMTRHGTAVIVLFSTLRDALRSGAMRGREITSPAITVTMNFVVRKDVPDKVSDFLKSMAREVVSEYRHSPELRWLAL